MADNPDYSAGTVSVTTGTKTVTGVGTLWASAGLLAGDTFGSDGHPRARIASINSNTSITLMDNWRGPTLAAGSSYWIRYQADGSRYAAILGEVRRMISGSANLSALSGLAGVSGDIPMFTGAGAMTSIPSAEGGRALLGVVGAAGQERVPVLTDVGAAAFRNTMASRQDYGNDLNLVNVRGAGPAALARSGDYYNAASGVNVDNELPGSVGLYNTGLNGTPTFPGVGNWWISTQQTFTLDSSYQRAIGYSSNVLIIYGRTRVAGGAWTPWRPEVPESGSNANGSYVRFGDGTQICLTTGMTATYSSSLALAFSWTFPIPFINTSIFTSVVRPIAGSNYINTTINQFGLPTYNNAVGAGTIGLIGVAGGTSFAANAQVTNCIAIAHGRWFA